MPSVGTAARITSSNAMEARGAPNKLLAKGVAAKVRLLFVTEARESVGGGGRG